MAKITRAPRATEPAPAPIETVLVLRVCRKDGGSSRGFVWPKSGHVEAPDWKPTAECGYGLHGWLWGVGDLSVASGVDDPESLWLAVEVP